MEWVEGRREEDFEEVEERDADADRDGCSIKPELELRCRAGKAHTIDVDDKNVRKQEARRQARMKQTTLRTGNVESLRALPGVVVRSLEGGRSCMAA